jgi:hypothetical protein
MYLFIQIVIRAYKTITIYLVIEYNIGFSMQKGKEWTYKTWVKYFRKLIRVTQSIDRAVFFFYISTPVSSSNKNIIATRSPNPSNPILIYIERVKLTHNYLKHLHTSSDNLWKRTDVINKFLRLSNRFAKLLKTVSI